jgi:uncharacterized protein YndB with AHSA1/START domain
MNVRTRAEIHVARSPEEVFDFVVEPSHFPRWLRTVAPIPGVTEVEPLDPGPQRVGSRRRITTSDGGVVVEEVLALDRPERHGYRWKKPKLPFSLLVKSGEGSWRFTPEKGGTRVEWTYTFELTTPLVYLHAKLVVLAFRRWMQRNLARIEREIDRTARDESPRARA